MSCANQLNVLSFNCWGLAFVSKHRGYRLKAIAEALSKEDYDIITLQEIWVYKDFELIQASVQHVLPYSKYFYSGAFGSGLAILSKFPIISTAYHRFTLNGKPLMIFHGDYYVGKGIGSALINHPTIGLVEVFNTHLHGGYGPKDRYRAHRATECWQLAQILRTSAAMGRQIILSGDFNSIPTSFNYRLICDHGFMTDSWLQIHGEPDPKYFDVNNITADLYTQFFGYTCNSPFNTFSRYYDQGKDTNARKGFGKRLDYIFYRHTPELQCIDSKVVFTNSIPDSQMSYSDHFGVVSIFKISNAHQHKNNQLTGMAPPSFLLCYPNYTHLEPAIIHDILDALRTNQERAKKDANVLLYTLAICAILHILLYIVVIVLPTTLQSYGRLPIALVTAFGGLLMNLTLICVLICLIVGFVFGHTEERALLQFINEIETFQKNIEADRQNNNYFIETTHQNSLKVV
ncbi:Endonuclease/exonuclease/phosphatase [Cokeromyces recurvatus]|uniref:Endonuclease/exonuclease/phosphatase n=1 Tax=Cokeromyces recurvatus TaxID=90255 RepID=UPI00221FD771|nr:Endonuclease/exonuclease/phosphatase [Cokeromyces recurvatus]KAI7906850.1 Endonuclease/exonuclease/phosphatase [Cokeromyces recurvatus]